VDGDRRGVARASSWSTPTTGARITSPVAVRGEATGYEGTVVAEVRADGMLAGESLGAEVGIAGSMGEMGPLDLDVAVPGAAGTGAVVVTTDTGRDVGVWEATVVRVAFAGTGTGTARPHRRAAATAAWSSPRRGSRQPTRWTSP
jgi:hypothetical protein